EAIVAESEQNLQRHAPGAELNFTQPIEMRFSELLEGITADVGIQIFGPDLDVLLALGEQVATRLERIDGAADVVAPTVEGTPQLDVEIDAAVVGRYGLAPEDVLGLVAGVQRGTVVGQVPRGGFLDDVVVRLILPAGVPL